jgi:hypothetical protein
VSNSRDGSRSRQVNLVLVTDDPTRLHRDRLIDYQRGETSDPRDHHFYPIFLRIVTEKHIKPDNMYNIDETGVQEGETSSSKVLYDALAFRSNIATSLATSWMTILEYISATGQQDTPVCILSRKTPQAQ